MPPAPAPPLRALMDMDVDTRPVINHPYLSREGQEHGKRAPPPIPPPNPDRHDHHRYNPHSHPPNPPRPIPPSISGHDRPPIPNPEGHDKRAAEPNPDPGSTTGLYADDFKGRHHRNAQFRNGYVPGYKGKYKVPDHMLVPPNDGWFLFEPGHDWPGKGEGKPPMVGWHDEAGRPWPGGDGGDGPPQVESDNPQVEPKSASENPEPVPAAPKVVEVKGEVMEEVKEEPKPEPEAIPVPQEEVKEEPKPNPEPIPEPKLEEGLRGLPEQKAGPEHDAAHAAATNEGVNNLLTSYKTDPGFLDPNTISPSAVQKREVPEADRKYIDECIGIRERIRQYGYAHGVGKGAKHWKGEEYPSFDECTKGRLHLEAQRAGNPSPGIDANDPANAECSKDEGCFNKFISEHGKGKIHHDLNLPYVQGNPGIVNGEPDGTYPEIDHWGAETGWSAAKNLHGDAKMEERVGFFQAGTIGKIEMDDTWYPPVRPETDWEEYHRGYEVDGNDKFDVEGEGPKDGELIIPKLERRAVIPAKTENDGLLPQPVPTPTQPVMVHKVKEADFQLAEQLLKEKEHRVQNIDPAQSSESAAASAKKKDDVIKSAGRAQVADALSQQAPPYPADDSKEWVKGVPKPVGPSIDGKGQLRVPDKDKLPLIKDEIELKDRQLKVKGAPDAPLPSSKTIVLPKEPAQVEELKRTTSTLTGTNTDIEPRNIIDKLKEVKAGFQSEVPPPDLRDQWAEPQFWHRNKYLPKYRGKDGIHRGAFDDPEKPKDMSSGTFAEGNFDHWEAADAEKWTNARTDAREAEYKKKIAKEEKKKAKGKRGINEEHFHGEVDPDSIVVDLKEDPPRSSSTYHFGKELAWVHLKKIDAKIALEEKKMATKAALGEKSEEAKKALADAAKLIKDLHIARWNLEKGANKFVAGKVMDGVENQWEREKEFYGNAANKTMAVWGKDKASWSETGDKVKAGLSDAWNKFGTFSQRIHDLGKGVEPTVLAPVDAATSTEPQAENQAPDVVKGEPTATPIPIGETEVVGPQPSNPAPQTAPSIQKRGVAAPHKSKHTTTNTNSKAANPAVHDIPSEGVKKDEEAALRGYASSAQLSSSTSRADRAKVKSEMMNHKHRLEESRKEMIAEAESRAAELVKAAESAKNKVANKLAHQMDHDSYDPLAAHADEEARLARGKEKEKGVKWTDVESPMADPVAIANANRPVTTGRTFPKFDMGAHANSVPKLGLGGGLGKAGDYEVGNWGLAGIIGVWILVMIVIMRVARARSRKMMVGSVEEGNAGYGADKEEAEVRDDKLA